jgi:cell division protein FtsL
VKQRPFLLLWTVAVAATVIAFVLHLGLRGKTVDYGYKLGKARKEQARLREMKRVLSLEAASYRTPDRVEHLSRTLLGMTPPPPERIIVLKDATVPASRLRTTDANAAEGGEAPAPKGEAQ